MCLIPDWLPMAHTGGPPVYDTVTSSRYTSAGIALIIVNQKFHVPGYGERRGAGEDARLLKETFEKLGFIVIEHFNKTARDIRRAVRDGTQTSLSNEFFLISIWISIRMPLKCAPKNLIDYRIKSVHVRARCCQATSHCLIQRWPK